MPPPDIFTPDQILDSAPISRNLGPERFVHRSETMTKLIQILLAFSLLLIFTSIITANPGTVAAYRISVSAKNTRVLAVEAEFKATKNGVIRMDENGAQQFPARWAEFVRDLRAFDKSGNPIAVKELGDARWKLAVRGGDLVRLKYDVHLDHESHKWAAGIDSVAFVRDWGIYATGRTYLITNDATDGQVDISFDIPKGWHVTTPWLPKKDKPNSYVAENHDDLTESMIFAGTHKEFVVDRNGFELRFALGGSDLLTEESRYRSLANGVMDYYISLMGGPPKPPANARFSRSVVILNPGEQTDGEVIGNNICIIVGSKSDPSSDLFARFIFAHEFFHLWNGKSIIPKDTSDEWFKEGFTNIYAMKALIHIGAISEAEFFGAMDTLFYKRYSTDPSYGKASMRDVASGDEKHKHWGLIYGGGMFTGMCFDVSIRKATNNKRSLDDLLRSFYNRYAGTTRTYSTNDLQNSVSELVGRDMRGFFADHIYGKEPIPIAKCLSDVGLSAEIAEGHLKIARKPAATDAETMMVNLMIGK